MIKYALLFCSTAAFAETQSFSLFLTDEEQTLFNKNINHRLTSQGPNNLTLKAIMMFSPEQWTIWINEHKITPESCPDHIEILDVSTSGVDLIWKSAKDTKKVHLKLNEPIDLKEVEPLPEEINNPDSRV
jgi:hypothetical protein